MTSSNKWTRRRQVFRRPPVCRSKPKADQYANYPGYVKFTFNWLIGPMPGFQSSYNATAQSWSHVVGSSGYTKSGLDNQGHNWSGTFILQPGPAQSTFTITVLDGPQAGSLLQATAAITGPLTTFTFPPTTYQIKPAGSTGSVLGVYP